VTQPCRYVPVNKADIISMGVLSHFFERHTLSLKGAMIFTRKQIAGQFLTFYFQLSHLFQ